MFGSVRFVAALICTFAFAGATGFARQPETRHAAHGAPDATRRPQGQGDPAKEFSNPLKRRRMAMRAIPGGNSDFAF